jgi:hypothetical protein
MLDLKENFAQAVNKDSDGVFIFKEQIFENV